jgi:hypothetical protein
MEEDMPKYCSECGTKLEDDPKFCTECGVKIFRPKKEIESKSERWDKWSKIILIVLFCIACFTVTLMFKNIFRL